MIWSKTTQPKAKVNVITLPRLDWIMCCYGALNAVIHLYKPGSMNPLFEAKVVGKFQGMTDSRVRKTIIILQKSFPHSGVILAYGIFIWHI